MHLPVGLRFGSDLWKFSPTSNIWTWMSGHNRAVQRPVYGVQTIPDTGNTPGMRAVCYSWTDKIGNLWLFGGVGYYGPGGTDVGYSDLWRYNIATNAWTWMKGDSGYLTNKHYGTKFVEDTANKPPYNVELGVCWTDKNNCLWLLDEKGCMWRYKIATNNWTWMNGDTTGMRPSAVYGTKGLPDSTNTPGYAYLDYSRWTDSKGDLWYLKGSNFTLWRYSITTNMWTWMHGDTLGHTYLYSSTECVRSTYVKPYERAEARTCWTDACGNLWLMAGLSTNAAYFTLNDLVYYDPTSDLWVWVDNDIFQRDTSIFGLRGVPAAANTPASRAGALPFMDKQMHLWLFGGINNVTSSQGIYGDMWMYTIDTSCSKCSKHFPDKVISIDAETSIKVFPNPGFGAFNVESTTEIIKVEIRDLLGKQIYSEVANSKNFSLQLSGYSPGLYILSAKYEDGTASKLKLILR